MGSLRPDGLQRALIENNALHLALLAAKTTAAMAPIILEASTVLRLNADTQRQARRLLEYSNGRKIDKLL
jgi:hypothetical protein